jgi:ABC-type molybdate transport system substrate-binding protein
MNTDKFKGVVELEILGEQRGFKYGMAALVQLTKLEDTNLAGVQEKLANGDISTIVNLVYTGAVQYAKLYKKEIPSFEDVANWIDHINGDQLSSIIKTSFAIPEESPNPTAP